MIEKQFINEDNLQIAMTEYKYLSVGKDVLTEYNKTVGTVTQVYDNTTGAGEQVYAVVKNPYEEADKVQESYAILWVSSFLIYW